MFNERSECRLSHTPVVLLGGSCEDDAGTAINASQGALTEL